MDGETKSIRLFLCGDVMLGRGIDQILPHPNHPVLYESYVKDARDYVLLAEERNGRIPYPVSMDYIWGEALSLWEQFHPDIKIINLETAITQAATPWPHKGIHYRLHPKNIGVLTAAGIDVCVLANNHILDWGYAGLTETLKTLDQVHIKWTGAGENRAQAMQPAILNVSDTHRVLVFAVGMSSSGVFSEWAATEHQAGVFYLPDASLQDVDPLAAHIQRYQRPGDVVMLSIHWGSNWGYEVEDDFRSFAHRLMDAAQVDVIFGHSSHHPRPIELYQGKPIFYGCGDFINDYEGIGGYEAYRGDLSLMYFLDFDSQLKLVRLQLIPMKVKQFQLHRATSEESEWMVSVLNQCASFQVPLTLQADGSIIAMT